MIEAPLPDNERERLAALKDYAILDTDPEDAFDDLTRVAARACGAPIALVSLIDEERQWFKSKVGLAVSETPRGLAFCSHAIRDPDTVLVVEDARSDERFCDNPLVTGDPRVLFYAGAPLVTPQGYALGTLCVIGHEPRKIDEESLDTLRCLARQAVSQMELRRAGRELRESVRELARANEELKDFTYVAAHDLQEPLRKLVSCSRLLEQDLPDEIPERASEDLGIIVDASQRMQQLIRDLLDLSRAGTTPLKKGRFEFLECVRYALHALSLRVQETKAEIAIDELPEIEGDSTLLTQLLQNLLANALKFAREEVPRVRITCERNGAETIFGVKDNGIGIEPQYAQQIFQPFKRLHGREKFEGTGIGLAIVRKAVERHGGRIWMESEPGQGAHFRFTLGRVFWSERSAVPAV